ncbi:hypothetical protein [Pseudonocardia abyssalis]|uniref:Tail terminator n=1 Tax=Pseudonocardia abyssalis TaxID=2792008 RepID=A0ABS6UX87_9PSEU|nr:hypothetical protein [Pseudonocardia abyssalis]MBW0117025.1 hypothetical protein [Pseudonocardia abyssalis]MBW0136857.1 hypothetical protein [Pseudonocardia abyssalis]
MNIAALMDELGEALKSIEGLRVYPYYIDRVAPPAAVVGWPEPITFDETFGRGSDRLTLPVHVVVGKVDARSARDELSLFLAGSGPSSIKQALDNGTYLNADAVTVREARVEVLTIAGIDYLSGVFDVDIYGSGS